jgi:hypothetical protein
LRDAVERRKGGSRQRRQVHRWRHCRPGTGPRTTCCRGGAASRWVSRLDDRRSFHRRS